MRQPDGGYGMQTKEFGGFDPPVTGNDLVAVINEDRVAKAKPLDAVRNLTNLFLAVSPRIVRSEEHTSELQSLRHLVCRLLLEKKKTEVTITKTATSRP